MLTNPIKTQLSGFKLVMLLALSVFSLVAASSAFAGWWHKTPEEHAAKRVENVIERLSLDDSQAALLRSSVQEVMVKSKEAHSQKGALHQMIRKQILSGNLDKVLVKKEIETHFKTMEGMLDFGLDKAEPFLQTLSPKQRTLLVELIDEMKGHPWALSPS